MVESLTVEPASAIWRALIRSNGYIIAAVKKLAARIGPIDLNATIALDLDGFTLFESTAVSSKVDCRGNPFIPLPTTFGRKSCFYSYN